MAGDSENDATESSIKYDVQELDRLATETVEVMQREFFNKLDKNTNWSAY